jgi:hypothetical protein
VFVPQDIVWMDASADATAFLEDDGGRGGRCANQPMEGRMNPVHMHLLLNHLPVVGTLGAVAILAYGLLRRSAEVTRLSLGLLVVLALLGAAVYLTGEPAEELVERLPGISEGIMEKHEEAALIATALLGAVGLLALGGLLAFRRRPAGVPRGFALLALVLAIAPAVAMGYTANLGGQIRHSEIRAAQALTSGENSAAPTGSEAWESATERRGDD